MTLPKITVVTPSFNQAQYLRETMESIHTQRYPNLEHIVMDGGSTDGSVDIIREYADRLTFWISEPDGGQTEALRRGFARATGDIFCWLNSDDLFEPNTLHEVAEHFSANPNDRFVYGDATWISSQSKIIKSKREHRFSRYVWMYDHNFIPQPSAFWRHDIYTEAGGVDPSFNFAMDGDLWMRFAELSKPRHVRRVWSRMRFYPEQKNTRFRAQSLAEEEVIRKRYRPGYSHDSAKLNRIGARVARVGLKLVSGGYPPAEVGMHLLDLVKGVSWETREARKSDRQS